MVTTVNLFNLLLHCTLSTLLAKSLETCREYRARSHVSFVGVRSNMRKNEQRADKISRYRYSNYLFGIINWRLMIKIVTRSICLCPTLLITQRFKISRLSSLASRIEMNLRNLYVSNLEPCLIGISERLSLNFHELVC